jgi:putative flippase GtrA
MKASELKRNFKQLVIYGVVGALATLVEWGCFYVFDLQLGWNYMVATAVAFIFSTFANWLFGKLMLFHEKQPILQELGKIYLTSIAGLLMNLLIMWIEIDLLGIGDMLAKVIATCIVFLWNFLIRKYVIYKI